MNRVLHPLALVLLFTARILCQEPAPPPKPTPKIEGPSLAMPGQELRLSVTGLTTPPLSEGIGKLQEWSAKVSLTVDAPEGGEAIADTDLSLGLGAQSVRFRVFFTPSRGGVYFLVLQDANADVIATKRITVGPVEPPTPNPPGPQPPTPVVGGKRTAILIHEASDQSPEWASMIVKLRNGPTASWIQTKGHSLLILDKDSIGMGPYQTILTAEAAKGVPRLVILDQSTNTVLLSDSFAVANPDTVAEWIKRTGG